MQPCLAVPHPHTCTGWFRPCLHLRTLWIPGLDRDPLSFSLSLDSSLKLASQTQREQDAHAFPSPQPPITGDAA
jgi:hypothetical protein